MADRFTSARGRLWALIHPRSTTVTGLVAVATVASALVVVGLWGGFGSSEPDDGTAGDPAPPTRSVGWTSLDELSNQSTPGDGWIFSGDVWVDDVPYPDSMSSNYCSTAHRSITFDYQLDSGYTQFETKVALWDGTPGSVKIEVRISLDSVTIWEELVEVGDLHDVLLDVSDGEVLSIRLAGTTAGTCGSEHGAALLTPRVG